MYFHLKLPEGWIFSKVKTSNIVNGSLNLAGTKFYELSLALSHEPSCDCVIACTKVRVRAQASYGNITVLSHFKVAKVEQFEHKVVFFMFNIFSYGLSCN